MNKILLSLFILISFASACSWDEDCYDTENQVIINLRPGVDSVKVIPELPFMIEDSEDMFVLYTDYIDIPSDSLKIDIYSGEITSEFSFELTPMSSYTIDISKQGDIICDELFFTDETIVQDSLNICFVWGGWDCD